jgi:hypothetical protein
VATVQQTMRGWFERWGLPARIRVDNGNPWSSRTDLPPALALWWLGLGIEPVWNPPRRPTKNPFVERCNGLIDTWGEPERCPDFAAWEPTLSRVCQVQREQYPTAQGCSRLAAHPELGQVRRPYQAQREAKQWELGRVLQWLSRGRWPRLVSKIGQIHLYGQPYRVGRPYARETVWVQLDPKTAEWVVCNQAGEELIRHAAQQLTTERICQLKVAHPRPLSLKEKQRNLATPAQSELYAA